MEAVMEMVARVTNTSNAVKINKQQCKRLAGVYEEIGCQLSSKRIKTSLNMKPLLKVMEAGELLISQCAGPDWFRIVLVNAKNKEAFEELHADLHLWFKTIFSVELRTSKVDPITDAIQDIKAMLETLENTQKKGKHKQSSLTVALYKVKQRAQLLEGLKREELGIFFYIQELPAFRLKSQLEIDVGEPQTPGPQPAVEVEVPHSLGPPQPAAEAPGPEHPIQSPVQYPRPLRLVEYCSLKPSALVEPYSPKPPPQVEPCSLKLPPIRPEPQPVKSEMLLIGDVVESVVVVESPGGKSFRKRLQVPNSEFIPPDLAIPMSEIIVREKVLMGEGATAEVKKAEWLGMPYAVKIFRGQDERLVRKEVVLHQKLRSIYIVKLNGVAVEGNKCMILMELMDFNLHDLILKKQRQLRNMFSKLVLKEQSPFRLQV